MMIETPTFAFRDWHLLVNAGPELLAWSALMLFLLLMAALRAIQQDVRSRSRLNRENADLRRLISDRNDEIHRLSNELEDARS
jgi:HAMP domain-containing protein